jgi:exonuclease VII small subunit
MEKFSLAKQIQELEEIEAYFQKPNMDLEIAIQKHQEALKIAQAILNYLQNAESSIENLANMASGVE